MIRRVVPLLVVGLTAASAHADAVKKPLEPREVVSTTSIELAGLPTADVPPMLKDSDRAPTGTEATGLQIGNPGEVERWRKNPLQATSFLLRAEGAASALQLASLAHNGFARDSLWISCDARQKRTFAAVRWEAFTVDAKGAATLAIHDGWLDHRTCKVMRERTTELHPKAVASFGDRSVAFAMRGDDGVTFFVPSTDSIAGDASPASARVIRGSLPRVTLPVARGGSASAVAFIDAARLVSWLAAAGAKDDTMAQKAARGVTVRIDATQTVSEDAPTLLVRASTTSG